jgi:uncharacterized lipoprotein YajG
LSACASDVASAPLDKPSRSAKCGPQNKAATLDVALVASLGAWMTLNWVRRAVLAAAALALAGCAVNRSELAIQAPKALALKPGAPVIFIRTVTDARLFEEQPKTPGTPSLGGEGAAKASAEVKSRAVARKRNGYGTLLGDVLLDNGQTVAGVVRDNLAAAFAEAGYAVQGGAAAPAGAATVDVTVRQFWAWSEPGFTEITMNTTIDADLVFSGKGGKQNVSARTSEGRLAAGDDAWRDVIQKGLAEFRKKAAATAKTLPR